MTTLQPVRVAQVTADFEMWIYTLRPFPRKNIRTEDFS